MGKKWYYLVAVFLAVIAAECSKEKSPDVKDGQDKNLIATSRGKTSGVVEQGEKVEKIAGGFGFTEGPVADNAGNIFFSDENNNRIHIWSLDGKLLTFLENTGQATGLSFDRDSNLIACEQAENYHRLVSFDPQGRATTLADTYNNKPLNAPNDLWIDPEGGIYFTDPYWGEQSSDEIYSRVYYLSPDRAKLTMVIDDIILPNGVTGTPDGKLLYVIDAGRKETYVYSINADGSLSDRKLFAPEGDDGMTIDSEGNIYITSGAVSVYDPDGNKIDTIDIPERPANVCFGVRDKQTLYITARTSLYAVRMRTKGL